MLEFRDLESLAVLENRFFSTALANINSFAEKQTEVTFCFQLLLLFLIKENQGHRTLSF